MGVLATPIPSFASELPFLLLCILHLCSLPGQSLGLLPQCWCYLVSYGSGARGALGHTTSPGSPGAGQLGALELCKAVKNHSNTATHFKATLTKMFTRCKELLSKGQDPELLLWFSRG